MNPNYRLAYFVLGIITGIAFLTTGSISPIEEPITFFVALFVIYTGGGPHRSGSAKARTATEPPK